MRCVCDSSIPNPIWLYICANVFSDILFSAISIPNASFFVWNKCVRNIAIFSTNIVILLLYRFIVQAENENPPRKNTDDGKNAKHFLCLHIVGILSSDQIIYENSNNIICIQRIKSSIYLNFSGK